MKGEMLKQVQHDTSEGEDYRLQSDHMREDVWGGMTIKHVILAPARESSA